MDFCIWLQNGKGILSVVAFSWLIWLNIAVYLWTFSPRWRQTRVLHHFSLPPLLNACGEEIPWRESWHPFLLSLRRAPFQVRFASLVMQGRRIFKQTGSITRKNLNALEKMLQVAPSSPWIPLLNRGLVVQPLSLPNKNLHQNYCCSFQEHLFHCLRALP